MLRRHPINPKVLISVTLLAALVMVTIVIVPQWLAQQARLEVLRNHVATIASLAAGTVNGDLHRRLLDPANYSESLYHEALEPLVAFHEAAPDAVYVYTMFAAREGHRDRTYFVLDTAASPRFGSKPQLRASKYMEPFELRPEYASDWLEQLADGKVWVTPTFQVDDYGDFLTGHAPIFDSRGVYSGFVGVDFDVDYFRRQEARFRSIGFGSLVAVLAASLVIGFLGARYHYDLKYQLDRHYHSSIRDELTGLLNRRGALDAVARALPSKVTTHAALLIDIDGLKGVNDNEGHAAGDQVIARLAVTLRDSVRNDDIVARIGGDEFLLVAPDCDIECARGIAEQIIRDFAQASAAAGKACSVSVGISLEPPAGADFDGMYRRADEALYQAKSAGKNRYHVRPDNLPDHA